MSLIVEIQLFPCVDYIKKSIDAKYIKIEQYETFQKMSFRNRYIVAGANGVINLSIPVVGGREQKALIGDVRINNTIDWKTRHWRTLLSAYSKAPFFDFYSNDIKNFIFSGETSLFSLNLKILEWIFKSLKINVVVEFTDRFNLKYQDDMDYRNYFLPKSFQHDAGSWMPKYLQIFEDRIGFQPNLSIIDMLFCEGPNSIHLLT